MEKIVNNYSILCVYVCGLCHPLKNKDMRNAIAIVQ